MRPLRLELEGFSAFARRTVIDLTGAELFALTGPTGAGKTSILDAMLFALYGTIPRLGRGSVTPVVTQGKLEAKVRFDFTVAGEDYVAVRVVERNPRTGSATTREARLESGTEVIASGVANVTGAVDALLGLSFEQFCRSVILPQGEFARFLHDKPAERQDLLVALLDLGIYERVGQLATGRHKVAEGRIAEIDALLSELGDFDADSVAAAEARVGELDRLLAVVEEALPALEDLRRRSQEAVARAESDDRWLLLVSGLTPPADLPELATATEDARSRRDQAQQAAGDADDTLRAAEDELAALPRRADLERWQEKRADLERLSDRAEALENETQRLAALAAEADAEATGAAAALDELQRRHAVYHLGVGLAAGDPCPVCSRPLESAPSGAPPPELDHAETEHRRAAGAARTAGEQRAAAEANRDQIRQQFADLDGAMREAPTEEETTAALEKVIEAERVVDQARRAAVESAAGLKRAQQRVEELSGRHRDARKGLQAAWGTVAGLEPPPLELEDVTSDWRRLQVWADSEAQRLASAVAAAKEEAEGLRIKYYEAEAEVRDRCAGTGVAVGSRHPRDAVVEARAGAAMECNRIAQAFRASSRLRAERTRQAGAAKVARELARLLRADYFEKWLLDEAVRVLAEGANQRLADLASGQYSLTLDSKLGFEVIDHFAADERRTVRTLSGGETFLVSLALALSLADHIVELSATGLNRLESIFLDEGFGTLDAESLEVVAGVIAEIGAGGKTVGLVTHVKELAEQMPVRFEVSKHPDGAIVARVEQ